MRAAFCRCLWPHATALVLLVLLGTGCDSFPLSDAGWVRQRVKQFADAIHREAWDEAMAFCDRGIVWESARPSKRAPPTGKAAIYGFFRSIRNVQNHSGFYVEVERVDKISNMKYVANVKFTVHITYDSMALRFGKREWQAKTVWVKKNRTWMLQAIQDLAVHD